MSGENLAATLEALFDAERAAREAHEELVDADLSRIVPVLEQATREALALEADDEDESSLRLVRIAGVLGELEGARVVDLLIDILGSDEPEVRQGAGAALSGLAFDRFKEVALGIERALDRLEPESPAIAELPYLLVEIPEPGVLKLLARFLAHSAPDAAAAAIEALVEIGDPSALPLLDPLADDSRRVQLEDEGGTEGDATIGELVTEARLILSGKSTGQNQRPNAGKGAS
jgi:HEAT repeat protein